MNNFGVIELATAKTTTAPGWAYVPDRPPQQHAQQAIPTTNRKRARNAAATGGASLSLADASARQEAKARREIEILDRDNAREVQIAIPAKRSGNGASVRSASVRKYTPNVRKILQSQKTFANHLDDYVALLSQQEANPGVNSAAATETSRNPSKQQPLQAAASAKTPTKQESEDTEMPDVDPVAAATTQSQQQPSPQDSTNNDDDNPLLVSRLPPLPSDDTLRALLAAPPLSYLEARGTWPPSGDGQQYPVRVFCVVCGYWGRVRCMKCGTRVCALECLEIHREECITRYGL